MIQDIANDPMLQRLLALWLIMLAEAVWHWPAQYHPLSLFRLLAQRMAARVNPNDGRPASQQRLSGLLAPLVLLLPIALCIGIFISFAEYPVFFDAILLLAALDFSLTKRKARGIATTLEQNKKTLARDSARSLLLRETGALSSMGLSKAVIESVILRYLNHYWTVLIIFMLGGGLAAFCFRVLGEFAQIWNTKLPRQRQFGQATGALIRVTRFVPARLAMLIMMLLQGIRPSLTALRQIKGRRNTTTTMLAIAGGCLGIRLGGPAIYQGLKQRGQRCGGQRDPAPVDVTRTLRLLDLLTFSLLVLSILVFAIVYALGNTP